MILRLASILVTFAALCSLIIEIRPEEQSVTHLQMGLFIIAILSFIASIILELFFYFKNRPKYYKTREQIREYMFKWISQGGRVTIFSRDMSWVEDDEMRSLLRDKANRSELCICLPNTIPLTDELVRSGAEIYTYNELGYTPQSRFTIINSGKMDAQVAIGRRIKNKNKHLIEEFSIGESPVFSVTNDLAEIIKAFGTFKNRR